MLILYIYDAYLEEQFKRDIYMHTVTQYYVILELILLRQLIVLCLYTYYGYVLFLCVCATEIEYKHFMRRFRLSHCSMYRTG